MSKIRHPRRKKVAPKRPASFPAGRSFRIVDDMTVTHLSAMRQASGAESLRDIARKIGCSAQALSAFEHGRAEIGPDLLKKYAKAIGLDDATVRRLFLRSKVSFHRREAARAEADLKAASAKGGRLATAM